MMFPADDGCVYLDMWHNPNTGIVTATCVSHVMCEEVVTFRDGSQMRVTADARDRHHLAVEKAMYARFTSDATGITYRARDASGMGRARVILFLRAYENNQTTTYDMSK